MTTVTAAAVDDAVGTRGGTPAGSAGLDHRFLLGDEGVLQETGTIAGLVDAPPRGDAVDGKQRVSGVGHV